MKIVLEGGPWDGQRFDEVKEGGAYVTAIRSG